MTQIEESEFSRCPAPDMRQLQYRRKAFGGNNAATTAAPQDQGNCRTPLTARRRLQFFQLLLR
jgi:hypothetical protein